MATTSQINQTLEESESLKLIAQAYSEIAALKLQKIRAGIERNRNFFQDVSQVFRMVKVAAVKHNVALSAKSKGTVSILLTSNHHFYGSLEERLIEFFVVNTTKFKTERMVIGSTAGEFLKTMRYSHAYTPYTFAEDLPSLEEIRALAASLKDYQQILVYYPRMHSVLVQEPHVVDILQQPPEHYLNSKEHGFNSIFEPEINQMLQFFDSQITMLLLEQTFLESELARTAARLISMEQAQTNADDLIKDQRKQLMQAKRSLEGSRLLDTIATLTNWRKQNYVN